MIAAVAAGLAIWMVANLAAAVASVFVWGHEPDSPFSLAFQCWVASTVAFILAPMVKEKIAPAMAERAFIVALVSVVLLWAASSIPGTPDVALRLAGLAGHALAAIIAIRGAKPASASIEA
jgi:hypothetical protein